MKIGIITMHKVHNFGSHLQAYALQERIKLLGNDVTLIDYKYPNEFHKNKLTLTSIVKKTVFFPYYIRNSLITFVQKRKFKTFENHFFNLSVPFNSQKEIENNELSYDLYITGSDQVWNPRFAKGDTVFMLSFVKQDVEKIAFGPSLAVSEIPYNYIHNYKEWLSKYKRIGVRDNNTKVVLENLLGYEVDRVTDPVFLLSKEQWELIAKRSSKSYPKKFIFVFILTYSFNPYPEIIEFIKRIREYYNLPVVFYNVSLKRKIQIKPELNIYSAKVEDFLWLIKNADFIVTSSFHVTAFSIIFEKQFLAFTNNIEKDSRIIDLCNDLSIKNYCTLENFSLEKISKIDYQSVRPNLKKMIDSSLRFLEEAIGE